jgi:hypothetical protein
MYRLDLTLASDSSTLYVPLCVVYSIMVNAEVGLFQMRLSAQPLSTRSKHMELVSAAASDYLDLIFWLNQVAWKKQENLVNGFEVCTVNSLESRFLHAGSAFSIRPN